MVRSTRVPVGSSIGDLSVEIYAEDDGLRVHVQYSTDLFDEATVRRMGEHYKLSNFHDALLRYGELPLPVIRDLMYGDR